jgi:glycosyltransferase involved in cell wall biosynthesis
MEAMASGFPVVAARASGMSELLGDGAGVFSKTWVRSPSHERSMTCSRIYDWARESAPLAGH